VAQLKRLISRIRPTILDRYIFIEILVPFFVCLLLLTTLFMSLVLTDIADELLGKGISPVKISLYLFYLISEKLTQTIPFACIFGGILAAGRLSGDSEITAMRSAGMSFPRIYIVFIFFGFLATCVVAFTNLYYGPVSARAREDFENWLKSYHSLSLVRTGRFLGAGSMDGLSLKGQDIFAGSRRGDVLHEIHIREWVNALDEKTSERIFLRNTMIPIGDGYITQIVHAKRGQLVERKRVKEPEPVVEAETPEPAQIPGGAPVPEGVDPAMVNPPEHQKAIVEDQSDTEAVLRLEEGFIIEIAPDLSRVQTTDFTHGTMDYVVPPPPRPLGRLNVKPDNYTLWELFDFLKKLEEGGTEIDSCAILGGAGGAKISEKSNCGSSYTLPGLSQMKLMSMQLPMWIAENHSKIGKEGGPSEEQFQAMTTMAMQIQVFLQDAQKTKLKFEMEIQNRIARSFACMIFFFVSFPLGLVVKRSGKGMSFALALVVILVYFGTYMFTTGRANSGKMDAMAAAWIPNLIIAGMGIYVMASRTEGFQQRMRALRRRIIVPVADRILRLLAPLAPVLRPLGRASEFLRKTIAIAFTKLSSPVTKLLARIRGSKPKL
jgi:lipopolysaccharide export system permease protein